jgi:hypothetical protein
MTEQVWLSCTSPRLMLDYLRGKASDRRLRLFSVACCRRVWHLITDEGSHTSVEVAERLCEGTAMDAERRGAGTALGDVEGTAGVARYALNPSPLRAALGSASCAAQLLAGAGARLIEDHDAWLSLWGSERERQAVILRDIFGNPFHPSPPLPPTVLAWNGGRVRRLAEDIYEERQLPAGTLDTARLPALADALLDAGCEDEELIRHCRSEGPHVRGCWAVDLILGRE